MCLQGSWAVGALWWGREGRGCGGLQSTCSPPRGAVAIGRSPGAALNLPRVVTCASPGHLLTPPRPERGGVPGAPGGWPGCAVPHPPTDAHALLPPAHRPRGPACRVSQASEPGRARGNHQQPVKASPEGVWGPCWGDLPKVTEASPRRGIWWGLGGLCSPPAGLAPQTQQAPPWLHTLPRAALPRPGERLISFRGRVIYKYA